MKNAPLSTGHDSAPHRVEQVASFSPGPRRLTSRRWCLLLFGGLIVVVLAVNMSLTSVVAQWESIFSKWRYCLPIAGRQDLPHCAHPSRKDLLAPRNDSSQHCFGSVLDLLMADVYTQVQAHGGRPAVLYGTLLGAVRNQSIIPFTEDADLGYRGDQPGFSMAAVGDALWEQGYYLFFSSIWRVCIAPSHPLAPTLVDRQAPAGIVDPYSTPYVDLYIMYPQGDGTWHVDKSRDEHDFLDKEVEPYSTVVINQIEYDTVADPKRFLVHEYGRNYMKPQPRG